MELVCLNGGRVLTTTEWQRMEAGYLVYRAGSSKLGCNAISKKQPRWRQRPKGHMLEHLVYDFHRLNPRYMEKYVDEDFVRRSKKLAIQSNARCVSKHVLLRYSVAACLRWTGMDPWSEKNGVKNRWMFNMCTNKNSVFDPVLWHSLQIVKWWNHRKKTIHIYPEISYSVVALAHGKNSRCL